MEKDYFASRATVRAYDPERHISDELLDSILERAMRAPTTGNMQLYTVIVTRDPERKAALTPLHFNQPASTGADVILTICADFNRFTRWCRLSDADAGYDNLLSFLSAMTDAVIVAQQIVTIAETEGLGTCYLGTVTYNADKISELLNLPELVVPVACLSLGYPAGPTVQCERLPLNAVVHREQYRPDSDEDVIELFRTKEEYAPNKQFVAENGKANLAQVFTDIRYPRSLNESVSKMLVQHLRDKGFLS
ncbi:MAG: nitroreductase family protein [Muribaculaceae bacterium]|nr:NADPH-dependent oxidoreductase [Bacteroides sp.]MDE6843717.1 nitroreductase family protein [Muribaculaceae bacterium]MDE7189348.1 nitroreductase family protein [Muribaculaceae bacterium]